MISGSSEQFQSFFSAVSGPSQTELLPTLFDIACATCNTDNAQLLVEHLQREHKETGMK